MKPVRVASALALAAACGQPRATAPVVSLPTVAAAVHDAAAPESSRTFAPWDGVYVVRGGDPGKTPEPAFVRTLSHGVALTLNNTRVRSEGRPSEGPVAFHLAEDGRTYTLTLSPPPRDGEPWALGLTMGPPPPNPQGADTSWQQRVSEADRRMRDKLLVGAQFRRVDEHALESDAGLSTGLTHDTLTVLPHGLVRMDMPDSRFQVCVVDLLVPLVDRPNSEPGIVRYAMAKVEEDCDDKALDGPEHGGDGAAFFFTHADGEATAVYCVAYMSAELFVGPKATRAEFEALLEAANRDLENHNE